MGEPDEGDGAATTSARGRTALTLLAAGVVMVVGTVLVANLVGAPPSTDHEIVIPAGTATRLAAGEEVILFPADLDVKLRDRLIVVNDDDVDHRIGPFTIDAGARLVTKFAEVMTVNGFCSLHAGGEVNITVLDR